MKEWCLLKNYWSIWARKKNGLILDLLSKLLFSNYIAYFLLVKRGTRVACASFIAWLNDMYPFFRQISLLLNHAYNANPDQNGIQALKHLETFKSII